MFYGNLFLSAFMRVNKLRFYRKKRKRQVQITSIQSVLKGGIIMATSTDYIEFVAERVDKFGAIRTRKMFGEYMVYLNDRPIFSVCDNTVFVKKFPELSEIMNGSACGFPYDGAKESYILDIENDGLLEKVVPLLGEIVLLPKPKKKKQVL